MELSASTDCGTEAGPLWDSVPGLSDYGSEDGEPLRLYYLKTTKFGDLNTIKRCFDIFCLRMMLQLPSQTNPPQREHSSVTSDFPMWGSLG